MTIAECFKCINRNRLMYWDFPYFRLQGRRNWGGAGGAAAPLAFYWEGQGGQKCPLSIKNII